MVSMENLQNKIKKKNEKKLNGGWQIERLKRIKRLTKNKKMVV